MPTTMLVVHHLGQVRADLEDAKATMVVRLQSLASRLPQDDPDREMLAGCIRDLMASLRLQWTAAAPHRATEGGHDRNWQ